MLFVLLLLARERRRIVHFAVTDSPTAAWTAQQVAEAFPWEEAPRYLSRDRDATYSMVFRERVQTSGHRRGDYGRAFPLAESVRRARDRNNPSRAAGSRHLARQAAPSAAAPGIRGLLPSLSNASVARQRHARAVRRRADPSAPWPKLVVSIIATSGAPHRIGFWPATGIYWSARSADCTGASELCSLACASLAAASFAARFPSSISFLTVCPPLRPISS